jgi:hypothetical protein
MELDEVRFRSYRKLRRPSDDVVKQMSKCRLPFGLMYPQWEMRHALQDDVLILTVVAFGPDNKVVGWGTAQTHYQATRQCQLYVKAGLRKCGIGRELLRRLSEGRKNVLTYPDSSNGAFFRRAWVDLGIRPSTYNWELAPK